MLHDAGLTSFRLYEQPSNVNVKLEDGGKFWIQEALLCNASEYFRKALNGDFREGHTKTLRLPGCSTQTFQHMLYWIVNREIEGLEWVEEEVPLAHLALIRLWVAAEMYLMPKMRNDAMIRLMGFLRSDSLSGDAISAAFELTYEGSLLRELLLVEFIRDENLWSHGEEEKQKLCQVPGVARTLMNLLAGVDDTDDLRQNDSHYMVAEV